MKEHKIDKIINHVGKEIAENSEKLSLNKALEIIVEYNKMKILGEQSKWLECIAHEMREQRQRPREVYER